MKFVRLGDYVINISEIRAIRRVGAGCTVVIKDGTDYRIANVEEEAFENQNRQKGGDEDMEYDDPYVISPDDFDENDSYDRIGLTYYSDGTVVDDCDEVLDDDEIDVQIGRDWINSFGEYGDDDVIHVRNEQSKTDYEIVRDPRKYSEAYPIIPRQVDC